MRLHPARTPLAVVGVLAFIGCGSSLQPLTPWTGDGDDAAISDTRADDAPAVSGTDARVDRLPDLGEPGDGALIDGPLVDGGAPPIDSACVMTSDCPVPLSCIGGRCRVPCAETRDCASGRCVNGPQSRYCLSGAERLCAPDSECPPGLVCAADRQCRNECRGESDCLPGQVCADQVCAQPSEVTGGHLVGSAGDSGAPDAFRIWGLSLGNNQYRITAVEVKADGCKIDPALLQGMALPARFDETTSTLSIGRLQGSPAMAALGSGQLANNAATLVRENVQDTGDCSYHRQIASMVTFFDNDKFILDGVEHHSMFVGPSCTDVPAGGTCTSAWRWRMELAP